MKYIHRLDEIDGKLFGYIHDGFTGLVVADSVDDLAELSADTEILELSVIKKYKVAKQPNIIEEI